VEVLSVSPVLAQLIEAKRHSDNKRYERKNQIIRKLMQQAPQDWQVDDPNSYHKGVTHMPTGFRLHVDPAIINSQVQQLAKQAASKQELPWRPRVEIYARNAAGKIYGGLWDGDNSFAVPGGGIDEDEDISDAAIRELQEEAGLIAENAKIIPVEPTKETWDDKQRKRTGRNFAGSITHFVTADITGKKKDSKLDSWPAHDKGYYTVDDAIKTMDVEKPFSPAMIAARKKVLAYLKKQDKAALSKQAATIIMRKITMRITATPKTEDTPKMSCVETLQDLLYNSIDMTLAFQKCHWNVKGTMFKPMHDFLGQGYDMMDEIVDELAERIATLDSPADGSPGEVAARSALDALATKFMQPESILNELAARLSTLIDKFNKAISDTDDDPVTSNMLQDMTHKLEKYHWMLRSQKEKTDDSVKSAAAKAFMFLFRKGR
jgi:starvation-inducible DNA-binding protein